MECVKNCSDGYYENRNETTRNYTCSLCLANCKTCHSYDYCLSCKDKDERLFMGICYKDKFYVFSIAESVVFVISVSLVIFQCKRHFAKEANKKVE